MSVTLGLAVARIRANRLGLAIEQEWVLSGWSYAIRRRSTGTVLARITSIERVAEWLRQEESNE